jgi:hypothetical protein
MQRLENTNIHQSKTLNETDNSTRISGYNHNIVFKNITLQSNGTQVYETFLWWLCNKRHSLPFLLTKQRNAVALI